MSFFCGLKRHLADITPYRTAASVPLALCRVAEPLLFHRVGLAGAAFTSVLLLVRGRSWLEGQPVPEDSSGSDISASNSWLSCSAPNALAGVGAAGTVLDRDKGGRRG